MRSRILLGILFGALGGFLGFILQERLVPHDPELAMTARDMMRLGLMIGAMLGIGIGSVEGAATGSAQTLGRGAVLGGLIGAFGGLIGAYFGSVVFNIFLFGKTLKQLQGDGGLLDFTQLVIARALGWTFLGAFPGLAAGASTRSRKRAIHGLIGGLIGGFVGGVLFDPLGTVVAPMLAPAAALAQTQDYDGGGPSRAIGFTVIGAMTGLFIGLVEELLKQAWVRVLAGRNEGKDYIISKPLTVIGRDERADVPVFGDPALAPQHAAIRMESGRHVLLDAGTPIGAVVNGQRVQQQMLRDGDMIQLGQVRLLFHEKATASRVGRPAVDVPRSAPSTGAVPMPANFCPFCGAQKDAQGHCLCTVPGAASSAGAAPGGAPAPVPPVAAMPVAAPADPMGYGAAPAGYPPASGPAPGYRSIGTQLVALEGPYVGQAYPLLGTITVGRSPENVVALTADTTVSRRHAHVAEEAGQHVVYDDGSSNGTFVNNVRVSIQALVPGDVVQFGASKFRYE